MSLVKRPLINALGIVKIVRKYLLNLLLHISSQIDRFVALIVDKSFVNCLRISDQILRLNFDVLKSILGPHIIYKRYRTGIISLAELFYGLPEIQVFMRKFSLQKSFE
jgi:hypothetical protein